MSEGQVILKADWFLVAVQKVDAPRLFIQMKKPSLVVLNQYLTMKQLFWDCTEEEADSPRSPQSSHGSYHRINLEGWNVGASMILPEAASDKSPDTESCNVNIYINNNVQGVNNSALIGSQVKLGDPGVFLIFRGVKFNGDSRETNRRNGESKEEVSHAKLGWFGKYLLVVILFLLLLSFM